MPTPKLPNLAKADKALLLAAGLASHSSKLSDQEKEELGKLVKKGRTKQGWTTKDRARAAFLVQKAAPKQMPPWFSDKFKKPDGYKPVAELVAEDPLCRLAKLAELLEAEVITAPQFELQRAQILAGPFADHHGRDPFDRLRDLKALLDRDVITQEQFERVRETILSAS